MKKKRKIENWIVRMILVTMVVAIAYHMFSYFLRLVYQSEQASVEFQKVMELVRGKSFSLDHWLYAPVALFVKIFGIFLSNVKIYKAFILAEILINVMVVLLLYRVVVQMFEESLNRILLCLISMACYLGVPAYFFLYGGNLICSMWLLVFLLLFLMLNRKCDWVAHLDNKLPALFWKIWMILICGLSFLLVGMKSGKDYVYFIPFVMVTMAAAYWKKETTREISHIYSIVVLIMTIGLFCNNFTQTDSIFWNSMRGCYWCMSWLMVGQAIVVCKEKKEQLEIGAYSAFVIILLVINVFGLDDLIRQENRRLVESEMIFSVDYFPIYMTNVRYMQTDYTDDNETFFGSPDFMTLAELAVTYNKETVLIMADENTVTEGRWFQTLTDCKLVQMDGLNSSDETIRNKLRDEKTRYAVIFKDSRIYMLNYEALSQYAVLYENERGLIVEVSINEL